MTRKRLSTLIFVIFLMLTTPLLPMANATNGRAETVTAFISWQTGAGSVTIDDQSPNYMINVSGNYLRNEFNWHYDFVNDFMDITLQKASFTDEVNGNSLMWMNVANNMTNTTDNWAITLHDVEDYNEEVSQVFNNSNPGFNSSNFCLFQTSTSPFGPYPSTDYYNTASNAFSHWCAPANLTVNTFTFPVVDINIDYTTSGTSYVMHWDILDCNSGSVIETQSVPLDGQSSTIPLDGYYPTLTSTSANYKLYVQLDQGQNLLESFTTSCTGTQSGNSGGNNPPNLEISNHEVNAPNEKGLHVGYSEVSNLTANTAYIYDQYLYPSYNQGATAVCDTSGGYLLHEDASHYIGGAYNGGSITLQDFAIGSNDSNAYPYPLSVSENYCYRLEFSEAAQDSNVTLIEDVIFSAYNGFNGCSNNEWCWDEELSHGQGFSFSQDGKVVSYYDPPHITTGSGSGNAIANIPIPPGKWYWEYEISLEGGNEMWAIIGVHTGVDFTIQNEGIGTDSAGQGWGFDSAGFAYHNDNPELTSGVSNWSDNEFYNIGIALDNEAGNLWYSIDGEWLKPSGSSGNPYYPDSGAIPIFGEDSGGNLASWDDANGVNGLANTTVYPAVSDTINDRGHTFNMVTSGSLEYTIPYGFIALPSTGFSTSDADADGDGVDDDYDAFPTDSSEWADNDGDGLGDNGDPDDDNDGVVDSEDSFPLDQFEWSDADNDGFGDNVDSDDDNDGVNDPDDCAPLDPNAWEIDEQGICVGGGYVQDELTLSGIDDEKFNTEYQIMSGSAFYVEGSGYSRTIQLGGDYYTYWRESDSGENYLVAWDSTNGYWMVYHLNDLDDSFYNTEEVINALDDSDFDLLDGKTFSWLQSDDYAPLTGISQWQDYPGTSFRIPLESDIVEYTGSEQTDDNEIEFCYDSQNNDIEDSYATEITCTEAGFMWSTDELKNLDISLDWEWGDYNNDGIDGVNLEIFVEFPTNANGDTSFTGLHEFNYILQVTNPENNQLLLTHTFSTMIDLESDTVGIGEFIEHNFPNGDLDYCIHVEISGQASTDTVSLDGICENMNVEEADSSSDDICFGFGDYLIVQNSIESSMNGRYFPSVGYEADPNDMTKIIEGDGVYWHKGENLDGSEGFGWAFYLAHLLDGEEKWVALQGTNPPQDLESEVDHLNEPWGDDNCKPDGYDSNYGHITYHEGSSTSQSPQLEPDIVWNPNEDTMYLDLHVSVDEDSITQVIVYYDFTSVDDIDNYQYEYSHSTGIMNLDSNGEVNYNVDFSGFERDHTYCFEFALVDVGGEILERSTGCMLISDQVVGSQSVDWESDVNGGSTSVTSVDDDNDGTKAIDDDFDTHWRSGDNCVDEDQEIIIELHNSPIQEYQLISGVSLKWGEEAPHKYNIFALDSNSIWKELATIDMAVLTDPEDSHMLHHLFHKIEASKIRITCTDSESNIQLSEVQVHSWQNNQGGPIDGIMDAYYLDDLTEGAQQIGSTSLDGDPSDAIDDSYATYWEPSACPLDLMIDLGEEHFIGAMKIDWATTYPSSANLFQGEIKVWNEQDGWNQVMNLDYQVDEDSNFLHFYPINGQKIMFKCVNFGDSVLKISEIEIFAAKSNWYDFDFDQDGKNNGEDACYIGGFIGDWTSQPSTDHDNDGCRDDTEDWDDDNDGINDEQDNCPQGQYNWNSWDEGADYDHDGCYDETEDDDDDADGMLDLLDQCKNTRLGAGIDASGCEVSFDDGDGDGVADSYDQCSETPNGTEVDSFNGCPIYNDMDGDGVPDQEDAFPEDSSEQFDEDGDGVGNNADTCPETPSGDFVDSNGCTISFPDDPLNGTDNGTLNDTINETANETAVDTDGDGVNDFDSDGNVLDECPDTEEGLEVNEVGCSALSALPPQLAAALDFILNIDSLLGLPDGTLEIMFAALGMMFGVLRFVGRRTLAGKSRRVEKYTSEIRLARSRRELENLERRITKDNEKKLLPPGGFGDLMELIETRAIELGEMDMASHVREVAAEEESMRESHERMLEEMEGTREAVAGLQDELSQMRRKGPPRKGRKGPPRRGSNDSGYKIKESGGPRRPSLHPADLDGDGFVTAEERRIYRERQEQEDDLW